MPFLAWAVFVGVAVLEVGGDAVIRKGLRGSSGTIIFLGCIMLGAYGVIINTIMWDFSKLLSVYVAVFALVSVLFGQFVFRESVPATTWIGLGVIILGIDHSVRKQLTAVAHIGNGPYFMAKSIVECSRCHVKMPSFFGYIMKLLGVCLDPDSLGDLVPVFLVTETPVV